MTPASGASLLVQSKAATEEGSKMSEKNGVPSDNPPSYDALSIPPPAGVQSTGAPLARRPLRPPPPLDLPALTLLRNKRVILASQSPRRKQLLAQIGLPNVEVIPSKFEENLPKTLSPFEYVLATAVQKALAVYKVEINNEEKGEPGLILAADTIVVSSMGEILGEAEERGAACFYVEGVAGW